MEGLILEGKFYCEKNAVGSISISQEVVASVVKNAAVEIDGVNEVSSGNVGFRGFLSKANYTKPIRIEINEGIARVQISVIVDQSKRIPDLANTLQLNIKNAVQNMTGLTVSAVDIVVAGISRTQTDIE